MPQAVPTYTLLDFGNEQRLEQWGDVRLIRPDPHAHGLPVSPELWKDASAMYEGASGRGEWRIFCDMPEAWLIHLQEIMLKVKLAPYKHTGVFPEQHRNWQWMRQRAAAQKRPLSILNLFAYTGGASVALAKDGHSVTHVDSSRPAIGWAKENAALNGVDGEIRWILEDAPLFASKELKRGKRYDAILLDPPAYGHGPSGKAWRAERDTRPLLETCALLLSDHPVFLLLNSYARHDTSADLRTLIHGILLKKLRRKHCKVDAQELLLFAQDGRSLSTGITVRVDCSA